MNMHLRLPRALLAGIAALVLLSASAARAQIALGSGGYQQNFTPADSWQVATAAFYTWTDNSTLTGWYATTTGSSTPGYYRATNTNGATPVNGTGNPGAVSILAPRSNSADGALGSISNSTYNGVVGARFVNQTGQTISSLTVSYTGEQWAWNNGGANTLAFAYSLDATSLSTGTWTASSALSFTALYSGNSGTTGLDGNASTIFGGSSYVAKTAGQAGGAGAANYTTVSATITGLSIAPGEEFWFRWTDTWVGTGSQLGQALAIDNLNVAAIAAIPEPAVSAAAAGLLGLFACLFLRLRRR